MSRIAAIGGVVCALFTVLAAPAIAATTPPAPTPPLTTATLAPSLTPDRLGAKAALTLTIHYTAPKGAVPSPVRSSTISLPAGLSVEIPRLRSCPAARLRAHGARGCPPQSQIGEGHALVESLTGSLLITEKIRLWAFLGPPRNLQPTVELLAEGYTPLARRIVLIGTVDSGVAPYGEQLAMRFPLIPTMPLEPDASLVTFSLTVGVNARHRTHERSAVLVPSSCPAGGFPFAANFSYADGSTGSALATIPCPPSKLAPPTKPAPPAAPPAVHSARALVRRATAHAIRPLALATAHATRAAARAARTITLNESGHLRLTSKHGFTLNESGAATGTIAGTIYVHLTIVSTSRVSAEVNIYTHGGSVSGYATASYRRGSREADFDGSMSIARGTGSYAHARGSNLSFSGTIQRSNDAIAVRMGGRVSL